MAESERFWMRSRPVRWLWIAGVAVVMLTLLLGTACGGGSSGGGTVEEIGSPMPDPEPDPEPEADPEPPALTTPPPGAAEVEVDLFEWGITPEPVTVATGTVYFRARNTGDEPHELVIVRTDAAPDALPVEDGRVQEGRVQVIGEIEPFPPGTEASAAFQLPPGRYVLFCNIVAKEDGALVSHYENGMYAAFTVTEAQ